MFVSLKWNESRKSEQVCGDSFSSTHHPMYDLHLQDLLLTALVVCRALAITYSLQANWRRKQKGSREAQEWLSALQAAFPEGPHDPTSSIALAWTHHTFQSFPSGKEAWRWIPSSKHSTSTHGSIYEGKEETEFWGSQPAVSTQGWSPFLFKGSRWVSSPPES